MDKKIKVGVVGLVFGGAFPTIYRDHPYVESVAVCDRNEELLTNFSKKFGFSECYGIFHTPAYHKVEKQMNEQAMELLKVFELDQHADTLAANLPYVEQRKLE